MTPKTFSSYPIGIAAVGFGLSASLYILGAYVMYRLGIIPAVLYLGYCGFVELNVLRGSCVNCCYYGKVCALGRGRLCSLLFKRGDPRKFLERTISFRSLIPDLLVPLIPLISGVAVLVRSFDWVLLFVMLAIVVLGSVGTAAFRNRLACRYCAQREMGCPADRYFRKQGDQAPGGDARP